MSVSLSSHRQHHGSVTGLVFSLSGCGLYSSSASGSLAMYDTEHQDCRLLRLLGNTVAKGTVFGPQALALSEDGKRLAFIGPLEFTITVLDASSLDEVGARWMMSRQVKVSYALRSCLAAFGLIRSYYFWRMVPKSQTFATFGNANNYYASVLNLEYDHTSSFFKLLTRFFVWTSRPWPPPPPPPTLWTQPDWCATPPGLWTNWWLSRRHPGYSNSVPPLGNC